MPTLCANLSFLWPERPFLERFAAAAQAGFEQVEILFPYDESPAVLSELLQAHNLSLRLINAPPGDWAGGERGLAGLPERRADFQASIQQALTVAHALDAPAIHVMSGLAQSEDPAQIEAQMAAYQSGLAWAADQARVMRRDIHIEPINGRDMPGYLLQSLDLALEIIQALDRPNLKLQFDVYHQQILRGDLLRSIERALPKIGHIQIAGVPERQEPDRSEVDIHRVLRHLEDLGYEGSVGLEYRPRFARTEDGLGWAKPYLSKRG